VKKEKEEELEKSPRERALAVRRRVKSKKPDFKRQESWRYKRVEKIWRKPRGLDSKMRKGVKGWPQSAAVGYRGPKEARGLHPSGYIEVLVRTVDDVGRVDPETQAIRIAHTVGARKRVEIMAKAEESEIHVLNPKRVVEAEEAEEEEKAEEELAEEEAEHAEGGEKEG